MPVIINEFEINVASAPPSGGGTAAQGPAPGGGGQPLSPMDLRDILRQQAERMARLSAW